MQNESPIDEIFISVCLPLEHFDSLSKKFISKLCSILNTRFTYWEFLIVINDAEVNAEQLNNILKLSKNIRLIRVKPNTPYYNQRFVAAKEALGDTVLIFSCDEVSPDDILKILNKSISSRKIIMAVTDNSFYISDLVLRLIGRTAGLHIDGSLARTLAYPRTYLNKIIDHPDQIMAIRFIPTANSFPVNIYHLSSTKNKFKRSKSLINRLTLAQQIMILSAPKILSWITIVFLMSMITSLLFVAYSVVIFFTFDDVQPGWFSTSLLISSSTFFLSTGLFGLSIGIKRIIDILTQDNDDVLEEYSSTNLFQSALDKLNVFSPIDDKKNDTVANDDK